MFDKYKPRVLHLFDSFEPGEVENRHFLLVKNLAARFDHVCWAEGCGELENGLERLGAAKAARIVEKAVISAIQCKTEFKACG